MSPGASGGRSIPVAALAVALAAVEIWWAVAALARGYGLAVLLGGHLLVLAAAGAWLFQPAQRATRYALLLWLSTASFGPLGPAGVLLAMALEQYYARRATPIEEWHAMLFPPTGLDTQAALWRRVGRRASDRPGDQRVTPFLDVLAFGSVPQRQAVVAIIAQQFRPAFAPALKAALCDEHNVIRVQAATAIARLEQEFLERTIQLETAVRDAPASADAMLALATHYDDQAFNGLLDPTREQECRVKAASAYERYLGWRPDDSGARLRLARLQLRRGLPSEAEPLFRRLVDSGHPGSHLWLMESLFAQGRYSDLRNVASRYAEGRGEEMTPEASATVDLWAGCEVAA